MTQTNCLSGQTAASRASRQRHRDPEAYHGRRGAGIWDQPASAVGLGPAALTTPPPPPFQSQSDSPLDPPRTVPRTPFLIAMICTVWLMFGGGGGRDAGA